MTLVEIVVVLTLLALVAGAVAPALIFPAPQTNTARAVIVGARAAAIARAQTLSLTFIGDRSWTLTLARDGDSVLAVGQLAAPHVAARLQITAIGACLSISSVAGVEAFDAARCVSSAAAP